ncbi:hypothetical protein MSAN_00624100 [Mycena sanguinolenta]|uniref:Uncharacterized protein n=1 Tax=Mycena sanguinolenta TaxID=230812 RepID=A0A8H6YZK5_9AGAR|nr:hypothetical protein MSAN_00624100 [Mycena sanguinolenta]
MRMPKAPDSGPDSPPRQLVFWSPHHPLSTVAADVLRKGASRTPPAPVLSFFLAARPPTPVRLVYAPPYPKYASLDATKQRGWRRGCAHSSAGLVPSSAEVLELFMTRPAFCVLPVRASRASASNSVLGADASILGADLPIRYVVASVPYGAAWRCCDKGGSEADLRTALHHSTIDRLSCLIIPRGQTASGDMYIQRASSLAALPHCCRAPASPSTRASHAPRHVSCSVIPYPSGSASSSPSGSWPATVLISGRQAPCCTWLILVHATKNDSLALDFAFIYQHLVPALSMLRALSTLDARMLISWEDVVVYVLCRRLAGYTDGHEDEEATYILLARCCCFAHTQTYIYIPLLGAWAILARALCAGLLDTRFAFFIFWTGWTTLHLRHTRARVAAAQPALPYSAAITRRLLWGVGVLSRGGCRRLGALRLPRAQVSRVSTGVEIWADTGQPLATKVGEKTELVMGRRRSPNRHLSSTAFLISRDEILLLLLPTIYLYLHPSALYPMVPDWTLFPDRRILSLSRPAQQPRSLASPGAGASDLHVGLLQRYKQLPHDARRCVELSRDNLCLHMGVGAPECAPPTGPVSNFSVGRRLKMMLIVIISPEIMVGFAARQRLGAHLLAKEFKFPTTHGFFFCMGGFVSSTREPIVTKKQLGNPVVGSGFQEAVSRFYKVSGSRCNALLACINTLHVPVTQLEVATLAFAMCAIVLGPPSESAVPQAIIPVQLPCSRQHFWEALFGFNRSGHDTLPSTSVPSSWFLSRSDDNEINGFGITTLVGAVFGAVHCTAWHATFPTAAKMWLWRSSSSVIAAVPSLASLVPLVAITHKSFYETKLGSMVAKTFTVMM